MSHGYDDIARVLLRFAEPKMVVRKGPIFELKLPVDADLLAINAVVCRELRRYQDAVLLSSSFDRTTDRTSEFWIDIPSDPEEVRVGARTYVTKDFCDGH